MPCYTPQMLYERVNSREYLKYIHKTGTGFCTIIYLPNRSAKSNILRNKFVPFLSLLLDKMIKINNPFPIRPARNTGIYKYTSKPMPKVFSLRKWSCNKSRTNVSFNVLFSDEFRYVRKLLAVDMTTSVVSMITKINRAN